MMDFIFGTMWGWIGTAGVVGVVCGVVAYFVPQARLTMAAIAGVFISAASVYSKGSRDRAAADKRATEAAVKKAQQDYDHIETRPDTPDTVADRLRKHSF